uniref:Zinc finger and BTB domain-containing protein 48 n=1 Tax=Culex pipiens TaxID=7175 RepID=A0A8D8KTW7_CULPI
MSCCIPACTAKTLLVRFPDHLLLRRRWFRVIALATGVALGSDDELEPLKICLAHFARPDERFYQEPSIFPSKRNPEKRISLTCCKLCHRYMPTSGMCRLSGTLNGTILAGLLFPTIRIRIHPRDYTSFVCRRCLVKVDVVRKIQAEFGQLKATTDMVDSLKTPLEVVAPEVIDDAVVQVEYLEEWDNHEGDCNEEQVTWEPVEEEQVSSDGWEWPEQPEPGKPAKRRYIKRKIREPKPKAPNRGIASSMKCYICSVQYNSREELVSHQVENHRDPSEFSCTDCGGKRFETVTLFNNHLKYHDAKERPFQCKLCPLRYCTRRSVREHVSHVHAGKPIRYRNPERLHKNHQCETCGKILLSIGALRKHIAARHEARKLQCPTCNRIVKSDQALLKHKLWHLNERPFGCEQCGVWYRAKTNLNIHMAAAHGGPDPFRCKPCQLTFRSQGQYRTHQRRVHDNRSNDRKMRLRFRCALCPEVPVRKKDLEAHIAVSHRDEQYPWVSCPQCPEVRLVNGTALTWHRRARHREVKTVAGQEPPLRDSHHKNQTFTDRKQTK